MSGATDRTEIAATRDRHERSEREALTAATAFRTLSTTVEAVRSGAFDASGDQTAGETAVAGLADAFSPLETATLEGTKSRLGSLAAAFQPTRLDAALGQAQSGYDNHDSGMFIRGLRGVVVLFEDLPPGIMTTDAEADLRADLRRLVELYRRTSADPRFASTLDDIEAKYDELFTTAVSPHLDTVRDLFGTSYEAEASDHVTAFLNASENDDESEVVAALDALVTSFDDALDTISTDRTTALAIAIDAGETATVDDEIAYYRELLEDARDRLAQLETRLNDLLDSYVAGLSTDVDAVLDELTDADPVLLLPIQLETRFARDDAGDVSALQIRVYPDDIHIDSHEPALAPGERELGVRFWAHLWWASHRLDGEALATTVGDSGPVAEAFELVDLGSLPTEHDARYRAMKERAWSNLVDRLGEERAAWVKEATAPEAAATAALLDGPHGADAVPAVDFDSLGTDVGARPDTWTRAPRARLLPDRWIAFIDDGHRVETVVGDAIPEPLAAGPGPDPIAAVTGAADPSEPEADATLEADEDAAWLVDFDRAMDVGMGLETPITDADIPADGLDVVVIGVKTTSNQSASAEALHDLLDAHHYTDGLGLLPPGTPTNATEEGGTPFASTDEAAATLPIECGPSLVAAGDHSVEVDGARLARLLAIDPDRLGTPAVRHVFAHVSGAGGMLNRDARAMNTALWSATWGTYATNMLLPGTWVGTDVGDYETFLRWFGGFRDHFIEFVRGGGPFPSLRVGHQPYGVLPTSSLDSWGPPPVSPSPSSTVTGTEGYDPRTPSYPDVTAVLRDGLNSDAWFDPGVLTYWAASLSNVPRVDDGVTTEELLRLLSMSATSYGYRGHSLGGVTDLMETVSRMTLPLEIRRFFTGLTDDIATDPATQALLTAFGVSARNEPRITDLLYGTAMPFNFGATTGPLEPLVAPGLQDLLTTLQEAPPGQLALGWHPVLGTDLDLKDLYYEVTEGDQERGEGQQPGESVLGTLPGQLVTLYEDLTPAGADSLLGVLLQFATLQEYAMGRIRLAHHFTDEEGEGLGIDPLGDLWELLPEPNVYHDGDESLLDKLDDPIPPALAAHPDLDADATYLDALVVATDVAKPSLEIDAAFHAFMDALAYLAERDIPIPELERRFTETLDLATHRADAWATSLATRRLETIRAGQADHGDEAGIHVGGYGTVTGLTPSTRESAGYLHAPSLQQSTTAAVLRSGHLTMEGARRDLLTLDLSATQVRSAKEIFDGLRAGQSLAALLGYRFERALHERGLDIFIPEFRRLAPAVAGKIDRGDEPDIEKTADTVDGLSLYRRYAGRGPFADATAPIPWGDRVDADESVEPLPPNPDAVRDDPPSDDRANALGLEAALDELGRIVDAIRDVLVAEAVHGHVSGRPMQGGASLDALARGESPPELTFTETPRSGVGVTHRLLVLFDESTGSGPPAGWAATERGAAEPILNAWFASLLPAPADVACLCEVDATDGTAPTPIVITLDDLAVAPMDLVAAIEDVNTVQRSVLEERIRYLVSRARGLDGDATLTLRFDRTSSWQSDHAADAFERVDPDADVPELDTLIELGAALELVRTGHALVSGGRPADASDLTLPTGNEEQGLDATALETRADGAGAALGDAQAAIEPAVRYLRPQRSAVSEAAPTTPSEDAEAPVATQPSTVSRLESVADRLQAFPMPGDLDSLSTALSGVDEAALYDDLEAFATALDSTLVAVAHEGGTVGLESGSDQVVTGTSVAPADTTLTVRLEADDFLRKETANVAGDGSFSAHFDLTDLAVGTTFTVTIRSAVEPLVTVDGEIVASAGTPSATPLSPPATAELETYRQLAVSLRALEEPMAALATSLEAVEASDLVSTLSAQPWSDLSALADWRSTWSTDAPTHVQSVLDLVDLELPGTSATTVTAAPWAPLADVIGLIEERALNPLTLTADERATLGAALDAVLSGTDRSTWATDLEAVHTTFETDLTALSTAVTNGPAGIEAATFALIEAVRDGLVQAAELIDGSIPLSPNGLPTGGDRQAFVRQAVSVTEGLSTRIDAASGAGTGDPSVQLDRLETIFGASFPVLPPFAPTNAPELDLALTPTHSQTLHGDDRMAAETWFERASRLRDQPSALGKLLTYASSLDTTGQVDASRFRLGQLPYREDDTWVGLPAAFDDEQPGGRLSFVVHPALGSEGAPTAGLFVDEWVEVVPEDHETTGLTFHHDRPGNRPPQSVLLAVPPDDGGWRVGTLKEIVDETLELARMRTVDTDALEELGHFLPALVYAEPDDRPGTPTRVAAEFDHLEVREEGE